MCGCVRVFCLLTMTGSPAAPHWDNMTNQELHDKFAQLMSTQVHDIETRFAEAVDKLEGVEKMIDAKLDAKFHEVLARLPPLGRARRVPLPPGQGSVVGAGIITTPSTSVDAPAGPTANQYDYEGDSEDAALQAPYYAPPPGRPHAYIPHRRPPPPPTQVREDDHVPKLKLNLQPFEGHYIPDANILSINVL